MTKDVSQEFHGDVNVKDERKWSAWNRSTKLIAAVLFLLIAGFVAIKIFAAGTTSPSTLGLKVVGNKLTDLNGAVVQLRGVNRSRVQVDCAAIGDRFMISPNWNDGAQESYADVVASSLLTWDKPNTPITGPHAINVVRVPLNESCWLGNSTSTTNPDAKLAGMNPNFTGAKYQAFVKRLADNLTKQNMYIIFDDHWNAPGTWIAGTADGKTIGTYGDGQNLAPNVDHSLDFWTQMAQTFKSYPNIIFNITHEPSIRCAPAGTGTCPKTVDDKSDWAAEDWVVNLYKNGGDYKNTSVDGYYWPSKNQGVTWKIAGTQQLRDVIRAQGACNPLAVSTLGGGNGYIDMLANAMPTDNASGSCPAKQLIADFHAYHFDSTYTYGAPSVTNIDFDLANNKVYDSANDWYTTSPATSVTPNYPVYVGEWGTGRCPLASNVDGWGINGVKYLHDSLTNMASRGVNWTAWGWDSGMINASSTCAGPSLVGPGNTTANDTGNPTELV